MDKVVILRHQWCISHLQFLNMLSQIINIYLSFKGTGGGGRKVTDIKSLLLNYWQILFKKMKR